MIGSLLIANRGEIAVRVIRTARRLGIRSIAVFSDADRGALHVREADEAVRIGAAPARESYLDPGRIIEAARATGAEAIHPGYGFLSENADFAEAVAEAGLIWIGPRPDSIRAMGLKDEAKRRMAEAGVPVTPGYLGEDQSPERLAREAEAIGWPVLIKAVAGGGGKGMRRVNAAPEFAEMLESCRREADAAFGDDRVLLERYVERPRHIEVQVFGDSHGNIVHLFERDCSLQRRHQKVIEEAPAPGMSEEVRAAACEAAVKAARAVDYVGAGTIEFIADASEGLRPDRIWFMEMNTRLQVEHPVTEMITGEDLVEWQIRVASGEPLPRSQEALQIKGWAMEARLYAEDPARDFLPSTGRLDHFVLGRDVRVDSGVEEGDRIGPHYDPMIAKLIAHGQDRDEAMARLADGLETVEVWPVRTNAGFLARTLAHPAFRAGEVDTGFIPRHLDELVPPAEPDEGIWNLAALALRATDFGGSAAGPWRELDGFRLNADPDQKVALRHGGETRLVDLGAATEFAAARATAAAELLVFREGRSYGFSLPGTGGAGAGGAAASDGTILAPMPGRVTSLAVAEGDAVTAGQRLATIEAMKMEHGLVAPFAGTVTEIGAREGEQVSEGTLLVRVEKGSD